MSEVYKRWRGARGHAESPLPCLSFTPFPGYFTLNIEVIFIFLLKFNFSSSLQAKMLYASSKEALRRALTGVGVDLQANDVDDIEYDEIVQKLRKGGR